MFGLGMGELMVILVIALIFLGPQKLPEAAKALGRGIRELRKHTRDFEQTIEQDEELGSTVKEIKSALRGDPEPAPRIQPPRVQPPREPPKPAAVSSPAAAAPAPVPPVPPPVPPVPPPVPPDDKPGGKHG